MIQYSKHSLKYGIISGILVYLWFHACYFFGNNPFFSFWSNLVILVVGASVFVSLWRYSKRVNEFSFGQGLVVGGLTTVIIGLTCCLLIYYVAEYIEPGMVELYKSESLKHLTLNKKQLIKDSNEQVYQAYLDSIPQINAFNSARRYFTANIVIPGLMFSILSSLPLRKSIEKK